MDYTGLWEIAVNSQLDIGTDHLLGPEYLLPSGATLPHLSGIAKAMGGAVVILDCMSSGKIGLSLCAGYALYVNLSFR